MTHKFHTVTINKDGKEIFIFLKFYNRTVDYLVLLLFNVTCVNVE